MDIYTLRFALGNGEERALEFQAHSTASALHLAQGAAQGSRASLYRNTELIARLRLVEGTGLWQVEPAKDS